MTGKKPYRDFKTDLARKDVAGLSRGGNKDRRGPKARQSRFSAKTMYLPTCNAPHPEGQ